MLVKKIGHIVRHNFHLSLSLSLSHTHTQVRCGHPQVVHRRAKAPPFSCLEGDLRARGKALGGSMGDQGGSPR